MLRIGEGAGSWANLLVPPVLRWFGEFSKFFAASSVVLPVYRKLLFHMG